MYNKLIQNDIRKNKLITVTITSFILVAAMLTSLAASLLVNLLGAIDNMLAEAKSIHYLQMHSGDIDKEQLEGFADTHDNVEEFQILEFLNIDGAEIVIGEDSLAGSVQDNGLSVQSEKFDFLLDLNGNRIRPAEGEIYVPLYYMKEEMARVGDPVTIRGVSFTVAGFVRDSMMSSGLVGSKRFIVSENGLEKVRDFGMMEYLIEFRLKDPSSASFESEYLLAGLPANGPPGITFPLVRMMNGVTDGIMIAVLVLISLLVIIVTFLCIRFTLIAKIEEDYKEIGVLKAMGLRVSHIKKLYLAKYGAIAGCACAAGFFVSLPLQEIFMRNIRLFLGESDSFFPGVLCGLLGAAVIFWVVILYVNGVLRRFRKISAAQAVRFGAPREKSKAARVFRLRNNRLFSRNGFLGIKDVLSRKKLYVTMLIVVVISSFLIIVPRNIYNTTSARSFMTYMGIGVCDVQLGITQTQVENVSQKTAEMTDVLARDESISQYTVLTSMMFDMKADDGTPQRFKVDLGDHTVFPVAYAKGGPPQTDTEIAISTLNADDLEKTIGDEILLIVGGAEKRLTVCGVYSDLTNGGKTSKAVFKAAQGDILGSTIPVAFYNSGTTAEKVTEYKEQFPFAKVASTDEYMKQIFGSITAAIQKASDIAVAVAAALIILVTLLFMKMLVAKDRYPIAILKSLGFTGADIRRQYVTRAMTVLALGVIIGIVLSNTLGELAGVAMISSFGASAFHFVVNPVFAYLFTPLLTAVCVYAATIWGTTDIRPLKISEHIKEV